MSLSFYYSSNLQDAMPRLLTCSRRHGGPDMPPPRISRDQCRQSTDYAKNATIPCIELVLTIIAGYVFDPAFTEGMP
jgi:hypothetical protein